MRERQVVDPLVDHVVCGIRYYLFVRSRVVCGTDIEQRCCPAIGLQQFADQIHRHRCSGRHLHPLTPPAPNPTGIDETFINENGTRTISDKIYVYPDAAGATQARDVTAQTLTDPDMGVKGGTPTPVDVGTGGTMASGTTTKADGPKSKSSIMFTEGKTFVSIDFESAANDPVPQDFVLDVARKQDAAIKAGLPG